MAYFAYIALDNQQRTIKGRAEQVDRNAVISNLTGQGLRPISIKEVRGATKPDDINLKWLDALLKNDRIKPNQLVVITRQLSAMVGAGVPLLRALTALESHTEVPIVRQVLNDVTKDIEAGATLAEALGKHPTSFDSTYVNMVRAGEAAGILDDILKRIAIQQEKSSSIRKKIKGAMAYPTVLMCIMVVAFFGLMIFIIPKIGNIVSDLGGPNAHLPGLTLGMLAISHFITSYWWAIIPGLIALIVFVLWYIKTPKGKYQFDALVLKLPGVKTIITKIAISRFTRTYSALIGAGVAVLEALSITGRAMGNVLYEEALVDAAQQVRDGKPLSAVIESNPLFPPIVSQMLSVGEETGQTDVVLVKVAEFYDEEVDVAINSISSIIEPAMIVIMGAAVGLIAASVMLPIADMAQDVQS